MAESPFPKYPVRTATHLVHAVRGRCDARSNPVTLLGCKFAILPSGGPNLRIGNWADIWAAAPIADHLAAESDGWCINIQIEWRPGLIWKWSASTNKIVRARTSARSRDLRFRDSKGLLHKSGHRSCLIDFSVSVRARKDCRSPLTQSRRRSIASPSTYRKWLRLAIQFVSADPSVRTLSNWFRPIVILARLLNDFLP